MTAPSGNGQCGKVDLLSLVGIGFLITSLVTVVSVTASPQIKQNIGSYAKVLIDGIYTPQQAIREANKTSTTNSISNNKYNKDDNNSTPVQAPATVPETASAPAPAAPAQPDVGKFGYVYPNQTDNGLPYIAGTYVYNGERYLVQNADTFKAAKEFAAANPGVVEDTTSVKFNKDVLNSILPAAPTAAANPPTTNLSSGNTNDICVQDGGTIVNEACQYDSTPAPAQTIPKQTTVTDIEQNRVVNPPSKNSNYNPPVTTTTTTLEKTDTGFITNTTTITRNGNTGQIIDSKTTQTPYATQPSTQIALTPGGEVSFKNPEGGNCQFASDCNGGLSCSPNHTCQKTQNLNSPQLLVKNITDFTTQNNLNYTNVPLNMLLGSQPEAQKALVAEELKKRLTGAGLTLAGGTAVALLPSLPAAYATLGQYAAVQSGAIISSLPTAAQTALSYAGAATVVGSTAYSAYDCTQNPDSQWCQYGFIAPMLTAPGEFVGMVGSSLNTLTEPATNAIANVVGNNIQNSLSKSFATDMTPTTIQVPSSAQNALDNALGKQLLHEPPTPIKLTNIMNADTSIAKLVDVNGSPLTPVEQNLINQLAIKTPPVPELPAAETITPKVNYPMPENNIIGRFSSENPDSPIFDIAVSRDTFLVNKSTVNVNEVKITPQVNPIGVNGKVVNAGETVTITPNDTVDLSNSTSLRWNGNNFEVTTSEKLTPAERLFTGKNVTTNLLNLPQDKNVFFHPGDTVIDPNNITTSVIPNKTVGGKQVYYRIETVYLPNNIQSEPIPLESANILPTVSTQYTVEFGTLENGGFIPLSDSPVISVNRLDYTLVSEQKSVAQNIQQTIQNGWTKYVYDGRWLPKLRTPPVSEVEGSLPAVQEVKVPSPPPVVGAKPTFWQNLANNNILGKLGVTGNLILGGKIAVDNWHNIAQTTTNFWQDFPFNNQPKQVINIQIQASTINDQTGYEFSMKNIPRGTLFANVAKETGKDSFSITVDRTKDPELQKLINEVLTPQIKQSLTGKSDQEIINILSQQIGRVWQDNNVSYYLFFDPSNMGNTTYLKGYILGPTNLGDRIQQDFTCYEATLFTKTIFQEVGIQTELQFDNIHSYLTYKDSAGVQHTIETLAPLFDKNPSLQNIINLERGSGNSADNTNNIFTKFANLLQNLFAPKTTPPSPSSQNPVPVVPAQTATQVPPTESAPQIPPTQTGPDKSANFYTQTNPNYANTVIATVGGKDLTILSSGCGPATASNILLEYNGINIDPVTMAKNFPPNLWAGAGISAVAVKDYLVNNYNYINKPSAGHDGYTGSILYNLPTKMSPNDIFLLGTTVILGKNTSENAAGIPHISYFDGYSLDSSGKPVYNFVNSDDQWGTNFKCQAVNDYDFICNGKAVDGSNTILTLNTTNADNFILTPGKP